MLGGLSDAVVVVNEQGNVLSLNRPAEKLLGKRREDLAGGSLSDLVPRDHPVARIVQRALSRGESIGPTNVRIEDSERRTVYALSAQVLRDASGVSGVMVSARDMDKLAAVVRKAVEDLYYSRAEVPRPAASTEYQVPSTK